ncbi:MAG TPA: hypothetical protein VJZ27_11805, partial [Aggregatilineales bacterium]|nr:hypothetical protein [Aggregatilineales bacterium]
MRRVIFLLMIASLPLMSVQAARQSGFSGMVLVSTLEIGATRNPNRFFVADTSAGKITELLVENRSTFAPWFGWSPDGQALAYLAPARRGINFELWLADARISNPNPRTPL